MPSCVLYLQKMNGMGKKGNVQNLIPGGHVLTLEEQKAGGRASVEERRRRKSLREDLDIYLATLDEDGVSLQEKIIFQLIAQALAGKLKATELIARLRGELTERHELTGANGKDLFAKYSDEELEKKIKELTDKLK